LSSYPKGFANHFIGVGGVVIHKNKILLVKQNYGRSRGKYMIPGGFVDRGETLIEAVTREIYEETGMKVEAKKLISVRTMVRNSDNLTDLYSVIKCKLLSTPEPLKPQDSEIEKVSWIPIENCFNNPEISDYTKLIIKKAIKSTNGLTLSSKSIPEQRKTKFNIAKYEEFWND